MKATREHDALNRSCYVRPLSGVQVISSEQKFLNFVVKYDLVIVTLKYPSGEFAVHFEIVLLKLYEKLPSGY